MTEPQDGAFVGQPGRPVIQPGKLSVQRHVVQRFLHRRIGQAEPLLQEVDAQHRLHCNRRATRLPSGAFDRQVQAKVCLFHGLHTRWRRLRLQPQDSPLCADPSLDETLVSEFHMGQQAAACANGPDISVLTYLSSNMPKSLQSGRCPHKRLLMLQVTTRSYGNPIQAPQVSVGIFNRFSVIEFLAAPHMQSI